MHKLTALLLFLAVTITLPSFIKRENSSINKPNENISTFSNLTPTIKKWVPILTPSKTQIPMNQNYIKRFETEDNDREFDD